MTGLDSPRPAHGPASGAPRGAARRLACLRLDLILCPTLCLALLASCKPAVSATEPTPPDEQVDLLGPMDQPALPADDFAAEPPPEEPALPPAPPQTRHGEVQRTALQAVLDRGPGAFLQGISVKPHFRDRRFTGWEIVSLVAGEPSLERVDLRPGDVVASINGRLIVRPRHLSTLWAELRTADTIVIRVERGGQAFELHFEVVNDNPAGP